MTGDVVILTATSGDTGKAALEGFHDVKGTRIIVFYPEGGVSAVQQAQMATQAGRQREGLRRPRQLRRRPDRREAGLCRPVRARTFTERVLSSANSINIGRLAPQVVYYFRAYADLVKSGAHPRWATRSTTCVPTGNFGDILGGLFCQAHGPARGPVWSAPATPTMC